MGGVVGGVRWLGVFMVVGLVWCFVCVCVMIK